MEFRVLQYFLAVAREENISKAAQYLHITQPTLSRQMQELEEELGKQLFIRGKRRIELTEDGIFLRKRAEEIVSLVEKTQLQMMTSDTSMTADIYIGAGETKGMRIITKVISQMQNMYPDVHFHFFSGNAEDVAYKLDHGLLDFGLFLEPVNMSKYDYIQLPTKDKWGIIVSKNNLLANKERIEYSDLENVNIICSAQEMVQNVISNWMDGVNLNIKATYNLIYNASLLVEEGDYCALALDGLIANYDTSNLKFIPLYPEIEANHYFAWKKYQIFSHPIQIFIELLKEELNKVVQ